MTVVAAAVSTVLDRPGIDHSVIGQDGLARRRPGLAGIVGPRVSLLVLSLPAVIALILWRLSLLHVNVSQSR